MRRRELVTRWVVREEVATADYSAPMRGPADLAPYLARWADLHVETLVLVSVDARMRIIGHVEVAKGTSTACPADVREVCRAALLAGGAAFFLAHNHPSGDTTPSTDDVAVTRRITDACKVLDLCLLDHVIVGLGRDGRLTHTSMKASGLMGD